MDANAPKSGLLAEGQRLARRIIFSLFLIHVLLLLFFLVNGVSVMVWVNVCSVAVYLVVFRLIDHLRYEFLPLTYTEILIHSAFATICVGWSYGFQLYCFSMIPVFFYCDYLLQKLGGKHVSPYLLCTLSTLLYLLLRYHVQAVPPLYAIPDPSAATVVYSINTLIVFVFSVLYIGTFEKMTLRSERHLLDAANRDVLTGLRNRRSMVSLMRESTAEAVSAGTQLAVAMIDINDFKSVNDRFGHLAGDCVLQAVAAKLSALEDESVRVSRWGGDEFLLLSTGSGAYVTLRERTDELVRSLRDWSVDFRGASIPVSLTVGCAEYDGGPTLEDTVRRADERLYEGKLRRSEADFEDA